MAGQQLKNSSGQCPEGYVKVFGPLCIEQTTLAKIDDAIPDLPNFDFTDPTCEAALAALKSVADTVEQAIEMPKKLISMAKSIIEKPFTDIERTVSTMLGFIDEVNNIINDVISGAMGPVNDFKRALQRMLDCPYIADTEIGRLAASILDAMDGNMPYASLLSQFKQAMLSSAKDQINAIKEHPLNSINNLQTLYDKALNDAGVGRLLQQMNNLLECVRGACDMIAVAQRLPKTPSEILNSINATINNATGRITGAVVKTTNATQQAAKKVVDDMKVVVLASGG